MSNAIFNIPVGGVWTPIQFKTKVEEVNGLLSALEAKLGIDNKDACCVCGL